MKNKDQTFKSKIHQAVAAGVAIGFSSSAHAAGTPAFLGNLKNLFCELTAANGPLIPIVAGAAIAIFAVMWLFGENQGGTVTTIIRIGLAISILVGLPTIGSYFGVGISCTGVGALSVPRL